MHGHDIRHISMRAIPIGISSHLYSDEVDGSQSDGLDIVRVMIRKLDEKTYKYKSRMLKDETVHSPNTKCN
jgi:hypothetical protein